MRAALPHPLQTLANPAARAPARWQGVGLLALLALSGCAPVADVPRRSRLTVAIQRDVGPLNLYIGASDAMLGFVYDKLFEPSPYVTDPVPGLAERAEQVDSVTWVVTVRDGVFWNDGTPFTAEDVAFTYRYYRDGPPTRFGHHVSAVPLIDSIVATDPSTVRFVCGYPCPTLARITLADLPILPKHIWEGVTEPRTITTPPVGTGPYRLAEYRPDQSYRFVANPEYYRGRPTIDELLMPIIPDQSAMFVALRTGQVDAAGRKLPPELVTEFSRRSVLRVVQTSPLVIVELRPNYRRPPFTDPAFRRALSLAVNRDELVRTVLLGFGRPGDRGYPHPDSPWTDPTLATPYDTAASGRLLDELGFRRAAAGRLRPDGRSLAFTLLVASGDPAMVRIAELTGRQLAVVGIGITVEVLEQGALNARSAARDYDLFVSEIGAHGVADPDQFVMSQHTGYLWHRELPNPPLDSVIADWKASVTVETRNAASYRMQQLFNREPTSIALLYPDERWAFRPGAYDGWRESRGYGILHKWSFQRPEEAAPSR